jgi:S-adenosylmethionine:tRNA ribosyltransferase-isomerase
MTALALGMKSRSLENLHAFDLPRQLEASVPPEARGIARDAVRMMVARRGAEELTHTSFCELARFVDEGDLIVINTSGTLAAEVSGADRSGRHLDVRLSTRLPAGLWTVECRLDGKAHFAGEAGEVIDLDEGGRVVLLSPYARVAAGVRLWVATVSTPEHLFTYLAAHGRPVTYGYVDGRCPLSAFQNVYATEPGSAEMPSAGRPFTAEILARLVARGVGVAPLLLHTGVSSLEASEPPYAEYYRVPEVTARRVNEVHRDGGRVIAVGTTVVRALETNVDRRGAVHPGSGWTELVVTATRLVRSVDGLLTGWHEPQASHLAMLEAIAGRAVLERSYAAALAEGYLWHEFGDVHLILP